MRKVTGFAVLVAWLFVWSGFAAGGGAAAPSKVAWSKCFAQLGPFECGTVQVPLDYSRPRGGATISLALVRLPAADQAHRIGSLFINPGGPGGSGVDAVLDAGPALFTGPGDEVRARFDIVGFDPRGIARSTALRCFGNARQWGGYFTPFAFPSTPEEEQIWIAADLFLDGNCAQRGGSIADHMSTANVARDIDVLRQAVGDDKLSYYGVSYGSYLGVTYANLFPNKVRALVVDGVLDPIEWATGVGNEGTTVPFSTRLKSDVGAQATLQEFFRLCDAGGPACAFGPNSAARFADLATRVKSHPVPITLPDGSVLDLNYSILIAITLGAMYDSLSWEDFAQALAAIDPQVAAPTLGARVERFFGAPGYISKRGFPQYRNFLEGFPAVACSDSDNPHSYSAWSSAAAAADANGYFGRIWTWASSICAAWPHSDAGRYTGPFNHTTANPVLVVGNTFDPATRYQGAVTVSNLLPNSRLLTLHGWGHTSLFLSQCVDNALARYLVDVAVPPPGAVCEQDHVPFTTP
jgi:pimeloyl-ACP methyl ester carboxylesterase